ncbi:type II toxin-antitoxin system VapC family toxin, partial [Spectribacter hydrogenoxidans]
MTLLLDTHIFLWALMEPAKLPARVRALLESADTKLLVSAVSAWEIATKYRLGKLPGARPVVADYAGAMHGLQATPS